MTVETRPLRIAMMTASFPVLSETFILNQIVGLINRGHEVEIFTLFPQDADFSTVHQDFDRYRLRQKIICFPCATENRARTFVKLMGLLLARGYKEPGTALRYLNVKAYARGEGMAEKAFKELPMLGRGPYDIIHCQFAYLGKAFLELRHLDKFKRGRLVVSFRGSDISKYIQTHGEHYYDDVFAAGDLFLPNCEFFRQRMIKLGCDAQKAVVFHSGLDCPRFRYQPRFLEEGDKVRIVTVGRLVEKKGIEYGVRAMKELARRGKDFEFIIVGDGPLWNDLARLIRDLDLTSRVRMTGKMNHAQIIEILKDAHIFIAPSVTARDGNQDGPVNTLKEAMAMGLPVIGTAHGGIPELIEDDVSGFLVPERDFTAVADKLVCLMDAPDRWPQMGRAGREYVLKYYDLDQLNDELVRMYHSLLEK